MGDESGSGFAHDFSFYTIAKFAPSLVGVLLLMVFTRVFSPTVYGRYAITMTFVSLTALLLTGWLNQAIYRYGPSEETTAVYETALSVLVVLLSGFGILALAVYIRFHGHLGPYTPFYIAGSVFVLGQTGFTTVETIYRSQRHARPVTLAWIARGLLKLVLAVVLAIVILDSIVGWLWAGVLAVFLSILPLIWQFKTRGYSFQLDNTIIRQMVRYGLPLIGTTFCYLLLTYSDRVLLEVLRSTAAVGIYTSNYSIVNRGLPLVFAPLLQTIQPIVMNTWTGDNPRDIQRLLTQHTRYFLLAGMLVTALTIGYARQLSEVVLGSAFHEGAVIIPTVAVGLFLWNLSGVGQKAIEVKERTKIILLGNSLAVALNLGLNWVLIQSYSYYGAALATMASMAAYFGFVYLVSHRYIRWRFPLRSVRNTLFAGLLALLPSVLVGHRGPPLLIVLVLGGLSAGIYGATLYVIGEFTSAEVKKARRTVRRFVS